MLDTHIEHLRVVFLSCCAGSSSSGRAPEVLTVEACYLIRRLHVLLPPITGGEASTRRINQERENGEYVGGIESVFMKRFSCTGNYCASLSLLFVGSLFILMSNVRLLDHPQLDSEDGGGRWI